MNPPKKSGGNGEANIRLNQTYITDINMYTYFYNS